MPASRLHCSFRRSWTGSRRRFSKTFPARLQAARERPATRRICLTIGPIPGTSINLLRQDEGELRGQYLFSRSSVERIPEDYAVVRVLPITADRGEDLFEYYTYTPGNLIAPLWYDVIEAGPDLLQYHFADQAYWQWLALAGLLVLYAIVFGYYVRWRRWRAVSVNEGTRIVHAILNPVVVILAASLFRYVCEDQINITGMPLVAVGHVRRQPIIWSATAWMVYQLLQLFYVWFSQQCRGCKRRT